MSTETIRLTVPDTILQQYTEQAKTRPVEWLMAERLRLFARVDSEKPIILSDVERREIEKMLARNLSTGAELVQHVRNALSVRADGVEVPLRPQLLARLNSRSIGVGFAKFLPDLIVKLLEQYAGMR